MAATTARVLVDTNVLVYSYDASEEAKQSVAADVLDLLHAHRLGAFSVQTLSEFFSVVTRKLDPPMPADEAAGRVERLLQAWPILDLTGAVVLEATRGAREHGMAYWDALIWAAAKLNQLGLVLSEDFQHDRIVEGVRFVNPFLAGFSLEALRSPAR